MRSTGLVDELSFPVSCPVSGGCSGTSPTAYPENSVNSYDESPNGLRLVELVMLIIEWTRPRQL
jgi:hypothetical protein